MLDHINSSLLFWALFVSLIGSEFLYLGLQVYNACFHPLSKFPGPKLAGASRWYQGYFDVCIGYGRQFMYKIEQLNDKYGRWTPTGTELSLCLAEVLLQGPIVRIAPNELHIRDVNFYDVLYAHGARRDKVSYMIDIFGTPLASKGIYFISQPVGFNRSSLLHGEAWCTQAEESGIKPVLLKAFGL